MTRSISRAALLAALACFVQLFSLPALAQAFPNKPVKLIVPWPPGGSTDVTMRVLAESTSKHLGQPIVVENRPGAGGTLGVVALQSAMADGYTITQVPLGVFRLPHTTTVNYDPLKDITYVIGISGYTFGTVVPADSPIKTMQEFAAYAKANPGKLNFASTGYATAGHMSWELFALETGIGAQLIEYKGSSDMNKALIAGDVDVSIDAATVVPFIRAGSVRGLAVMSSKRTPLMPVEP